MKNILDYLEQLDFSKTEAKIYLTLFRSGQMTVSELAENAKINRTAAYGYIKSLLDKGIIAEVKGKSKKIIANPPEQLQYLLEQKAIAIKTPQEKLPLITNALYTSLPQTKKESNPEMKYYKGRAGGSSPAFVTAALVIVSACSSDCVFM